MYSSMREVRSLFVTIPRGRQTNHTQISMDLISIMRPAARLRSQYHQRPIPQRRRTRCWVRIDHTNKNVTNSNTIQYNIPVSQSGTYDVELFFGFKNGDTGFTSGSRRFNIYAENQLIALYDIYDSIGTHGASSYPFTKTVSDGVLNLKFVATSGSEAQINAIRVTGPVSGGGRAVAQKPVSANVDAETTGDRAIKIFPNPASTYLEISGRANESYTARIIDVQQRIVGSYDFVAGPDQSQRLDISQLRSNELYVLQIISANGAQKYLSS